MGPALLRRVISVAANVWCDIGEGRIKREHVPELNGWLSAIDEEARSARLDFRDRGRVILRALQGVPKMEGDKWLRTAAIAHVVAWRLDEYFCTSVEADDLALAGSRGAAHWVFERFSKTYVSEWSETSRAWEEAFLDFPADVARRLSVPLVVLNERIVVRRQLSDARLQAIMAESMAPEVAGLPVNEVVEAVLVQLESGYIEGAQSLADRALDQVPENMLVRLLAAFCRLPLAPSWSREVWEGALRDGESVGGSPDVLRADIAASYLMEGEFQKALECVEQINRADDHVAWLWEPGSLPSEPSVRYLSLSAWCASFDELRR